VERALVDLWSRTAQGLSTPQREELRAALERWLSCGGREVAHRAACRVPDPIDYVEMRRVSFAMEAALLMASMAPDMALPPEVRSSRPVREMELCACDFICLHNDIYSYEKEIEFEGDPHNSVLVLQHFLGCDLALAVAWIERLIAARVRRFEHIVATELPALAKDLALTAQGVDRLNRWAKLLEQWMGGLRTHSITVRRYHRDEAQRMSPLYRRSSTRALRPALLSALKSGASSSPKPPAAPTDSRDLPALPDLKGLGTSAARLFAILGEKSIPQ